MKKRNTAYVFMIILSLQVLSLSCLGRFVDDSYRYDEEAKISPDGKILFEYFANTMRNSYLWRLTSLESGETILSSNDRLNYHSLCTFSPDSNYFMYENDILIKNIQICSIKSREKDVFNRQIARSQINEKQLLKFSPDMKYLAYLYESQQINIWSFDERKDIRSFPFESESSIQDHSFTYFFSSDGKYFVIHIMDRIHIYDFASGDLLFTHDISSWLNYVTMTPDTSLIAYVNRNDNFNQTNKIKIRKPDSWELVHTFPGEKFILSPDGEKIATVTEDRIYVFSLITGREILNIPKAHKQKSNSSIEPAAIEFSPDSSLVMTIRDNEVLNLWSISDGKSLLEMTSYESEFTPDQKKLVFLTYGGTRHSKESWSLNTWDIETGETDTLYTTKYIEGERYPEMTDLSLSDDGDKLSFDCNGLNIWSRSQGKLIYKEKGAKVHFNNR